MLQSDTNEWLNSSIHFIDQTKEVLLFFLSTIVSVLEDHQISMHISESHIYRSAWQILILRRQWKRKYRLFGMQKKGLWRKKTTCWRDFVDHWICRYERLDTFFCCSMEPNGHNRWKIISTHSLWFHIYFKSSEEEEEISC